MDCVEQSGADKETVWPCFLSRGAVIWRGRDVRKGSLLPSPSPFARRSKASDSGFFQTLPADKGACRRAYWVT